MVQGRQLRGEEGMDDPGRYTEEGAPGNCCPEHHRPMEIIQPLFFTTGNTSVSTRKRNPWRRKEREGIMIITNPVK